MREEFDTPAGGFKLPSPYLSHSQIDMYLRCPKQYEFRYIQGISRPPSAALAHGKSTHSALELTHNHLVDHGEPVPTPEMEAKFSDAFDQSVTEVPGDSWVSEGMQPGQLKDVGLKLIRIYNQVHAPKVKPAIFSEGVRGIEKRFETNVVGVPLVGYIDLIDTNATESVSENEQQLLEHLGKEVPTLLRTAVVDFKTKSKSMSDAEVQGMFQLSLYSYVEQIPMVRVDQLLKLKTPKITRITAVRHASDHLWMKNIIHGVAKAITAGIFPPCDPSSWICTERWCGYYFLCRGRRV